MPGAAAVVPPERAAAPPVREQSPGCRRFTGVLHRIGLVMLLGLGCGPPDRRPAVAPVTRPAVARAGGGTPCFPGRPPVRIAAVFDELHRYRIGTGTDPRGLPRGRFGDCSIAEGQVVDPRGVVVAELPCGIVVKVPGWIDPYGVQVGSQGRLAVDRHVAAGSRASCMARGAGRSACWFTGSRGMQEVAYVVDGELGEEWLADQAALDFLAARRIAQVSYLPDCH